MKTVIWYSMETQLWRRINSSGLSICDAWELGRMPPFHAVLWTNLVGSAVREVIL